MSFMATGAFLEGTKFSLEGFLSPGKQAFLVWEAETAVMVLFGVSLQTH